MEGIMDDIYMRIDEEYTSWRDGKLQQKWLPANRSLDLVSEHEKNGNLVRAFEEAQKGRAGWKNDPLHLVAFVRDRAARLFLVIVYTRTLPLLDQFCTQDVGDDEFPSVNTKFDGTRVTFNEKPGMKLEFDPEIKREVDLLFNYFQWIFFVHKLVWAAFESPPIPFRSNLPFIGQQEVVGRTGFSTVYKAVVHPSHIANISDYLVKSPSRRPLVAKIAANEQGHPYVAVKSILPTGIDKADFETFVRAEHETLDMLREAKSPHLIKAVAFYRSESTELINFVLPYAQHGNLRTFWENRIPSVDDTNYMKWIFSQLHGLACAILEMHKLLRHYCRHGDLKPENILCFDANSTVGVKDQTSCVLVIADVGISRTHDKTTAFRTRTKLAKADTVVYAAPETELFPENPTSRRADIWALGCLYLEFLIWLLHGNSGLERFGRDVGRSGRFYTTSNGTQAALSPDKVAKLNPTVGRWINDIKKDSRCAGTSAKQTAVGRLLAFVEERMLHPKATPNPVAPASAPSSASGVDRANDGLATTNAEEHPEIPQVLLQRPTFPHTPVRNMLDNERADATEVHDVLSSIVRDANKGKINFINTEKRESTIDSRTGLARNPRDRTPQLDDKWNYVADQNVAQRLRAELGQSPRTQEPSDLCGRCCNLPLWSRECFFDGTVAELARKADTCSLCRLLSRSLANRATLPNDRLHFFRVDSSLKFNNSQLPPILSLCALPQAYDANAVLESHVQLGFPTLPDAGSPLHTKLLREWIRDCDTTHQCLGSPNEPPFLPTRLLDVGTRGSTRTRLICNTAMLDAGKDKYLALSHRWGSPPKRGEPDAAGAKFVCTFEKNIGTIAGGIDDSDLPEKYRDAVSIARRLDVQYLWIDSLCIIQEDKSDPLDKDKGQDFKKEAERMERVFRSAYATLAACCASSSDEPFLKCRRARQCVTMQAGEALYYLCDAIDDFSRDVEQGALNKRGWVFQERALSRRTIHFTETQTYWECGEGVRCETLTRVTSPTPSFLGDADFPSSLLKYGAGKGFELYQDLYVRYSRLALSHITDRPVAIRGLETRLLSLLRTAGGYGIFETGLCRGLLWQREEASIDRIDFSGVHTAQGRVPSWSWMAHAGPIRYMDVPFEWVSSDEIESPWKAARGGSSGTVDAIELRCLIRDMHDMEPGVQIFLDNNSSGTFKRTFKCVVLGSSTTSRGNDKYYALIVTPAGVGDGEEDVYARAGVASLMKRHVAWSNPKSARIR